MTSLPESILFPIAPDDPLATAHATLQRFVDDVLSCHGGGWDWDPPRDASAAKAIVDSSRELAVHCVLAAMIQLDHFDKLASRLEREGGSVSEKKHPHRAAIDEALSRFHQTSFLLEALLQRPLPFQEPDLLALLNWAMPEDLRGHLKLRASSLVSALRRFTSKMQPTEPLSRVMRLLANQLRGSADAESRKYAISVEKMIGDQEFSGDDDEPARSPAPRPAPAGAPNLLCSIKVQLGMISPASDQATRSDIISIGLFDLPANGQKQFLSLAKRIQRKDRTDKISRDELCDLCLFLAGMQPWDYWGLHVIVSDLLGLVEMQVRDAPLSEGERYVLWFLRAALLSGPPFGKYSDDVRRLTRLIGDGAHFCLAPGERWSDAVNGDFSELSSEQRKAWSQLFLHASGATSARPTAKWLKTASKLLSDVGPVEVQDRLATWLPLVDQGRWLLPNAYLANQLTSDEHATCLRGLLWMVQLLPHPDELVRDISALAIAGYKKVPGVGPRSVKVGNAAVYALSSIGSKLAVAQLAILKVRVKVASAQKELEKAFTLAAEKLGLAREEIEEMAVPSYGLEEVGLRREAIGEYSAELVVNGLKAELRWFDRNGKQLKSVPAKVKSDYKEEQKELAQALKDVQSMLPAQRDRLDSMFLVQRSWPIDVWRERYLNHPLVGTIATSLIWCVDGTAAFFIDGQATDVRGAPIPHGEAAEITMWHPVGQSIESITAWRRRLADLGVTQPFKQAHREIYLLTDAERNTRTYSNRFAAHVIRQHQFHALCAARGWKDQLRLMVDKECAPPTKELPQWGLRAELWVEGIGDEYGVDTNDTGSFLRLATDQVRFYRLQAAVNYAHASGGGFRSVAVGPGVDDVDEPLPLEEVPPLVFSEVMRDVDLFVGVASIGNDPTWQDGGPEGRYRDYWQGYAFGDLSGTAKTRKEVLEGLIPRLKIASRCSFSDRFLVVQGEIRTYKIHLGSGNIMMEPNDQYLCIVPDSKARAPDQGLFLPFEGDSMLSIILSKALLLAEDQKIKDPTIVRQIERS